MLAFLTSFLLIALAPSAQAADRVYWVNQSAPNKISWANVDGSGGGDLSTAGAPGAQPRGVAMDVAAGRVYWTDRAANLIVFANLDGSGGGGSLNTAGAIVNVPNAAAVYPAAGRIYWANETADRISFANLDNSGGGNLTISGATVDIPIAPVVDPGSRRIYWGNGGAVNVISYAALDGSGGGDLSVTGATVNNPHGLALDPVAGRIYWANVDGSPQRISYANLDGSGGGDLNTGAATVHVPVGVAIDPAARRIYWANQVGNTISFAKLDGSGGGNLPTPGATLSGSRSPVLLKAPSGAGAPAIGGGAKAGATLSCSAGSWAPDLLGSWLYRAPRSLAYSWTRDGAAIPGANDSTYTASSAGAYRCTVTASNPAGSSSQTSTAHAVSRGGSSRPAFGRQTLVTISLAARRIPARGPLKVVVGNRNDFRISGKLSAQTKKGASGSRRRRLVIRGTAFEVGARAKKSVTLKLPKGVRRLLERQRKLSLRLSVKVTDPAGNTRTLTKSVSLRLKT